MLEPHMATPDQIDALAEHARGVVAGAEAFAEANGMMGEPGACTLLIMALAMSVAKCSGDGASMAHVMVGANMAAHGLMQAVPLEFGIMFGNEQRPSQ